MAYPLSNTKWGRGNRISELVRKTNPLHVNQTLSKVLAGLSSFTFPSTFFQLASPCICSSVDPKTPTAFISSLLYFFVSCLSVSCTNPTFVPAALESRDPGYKKLGHVCLIRGNFISRFLVCGGTRLSLRLYGLGGVRVCVGEFCGMCMYV